MFDTLQENSIVYASGILVLSAFLIANLYLEKLIQDMEKGHCDCESCVKKKRKIN